MLARDPMLETHQEGVGPDLLEFWRRSIRPLQTYTAVCGERSVTEEAAFICVMQHLQKGMTGMKHLQELDTLV